MTALMNNITPKPAMFGSEPRMSSREIAELAGKNHAHVCRDIRKMCEQLEINESKFGSVYIDSKNESRTEYLLPKDMTMTLVSGYNVRLRHAIVLRWQELESGSFRPELPTMKELAMMVIRAEEEKERAQAQIEADRPKVIFAESLKGSSNDIDLTQCAKRLGAGPNKLRNWLRSHGVLMADNVPYQRFCDGRFRVDTRVRRNRDGEDVSYSVTLITPRGFIWLEKQLREFGGLDRV